MRRLMRKLFHRDDGVAMVWLASTVVLLIGVAGFAVDLGWMYLNASKVQRAADSAAMAGVVHLPGFLVQANADAQAAAEANGYDFGTPLNPGPDEIASVALSDNELHVELRTQIPSFFVKVLGFDHFTITRDATAQYIKPVPLGSPNRCFGQDPTGTYCPADPTDFWAAVSAPYTLKRDGDPYSTHCVNNSNQSNCSSNNVMYAREGSYGGYYFGVEVPSGVSNVAVRVYDAAFMERPNYPNVETADERYSPGSPNNGVTTSFQLHMVDSTPSDPTDNPPIAGCSWSLNPDSSDGPGDFINEWRTLCTLAGAVTPGVYVLHVESTGIGSGTNNYSLAATSGSGPQPRVFGINDMSIFSNKLVAGNPSQLYLVEVEPDHAGSKLELQFFDAGDASGASFMRVRDPHGNIPNCSWEVSPHHLNSMTSSGSGPCAWQTTTAGGSQLFQNQWITAVIDIPDAYTCNGPDCFWYMELELSQPNERTTWRARIIGNPVRLIP